MFLVIPLRKEIPSENKENSLYLSCPFSCSSGDQYRFCGLPATDEGEPAG
jgi:hypothetical protein